MLKRRIIPLLSLLQGRLVKTRYLQILEMLDTLLKARQYAAIRMRMNYCPFLTSLRKKRYSRSIIPFLKKSRLVASYLPISDGGGISFFY